MMPNQSLRVLSTALLAVSCTLTTLASAAEEAAASTESPATVTIYKHSAWSPIAPKGVDADGIRRNLAPGDSVTFQDLTLTVTKMQNPEEAGAELDQVGIDLTLGEKSDSRTVSEGDAFNWEGYHIAAVAAYTSLKDLGRGSAVIEIATVESLPKEVAESELAGGAENRLRVKHTIDKLTLHHSGTTHVAGDDLGLKLRNMQKWGENDRNWFDVPYHFIIDTDGTVFAARDHRYVGDTNTRYDPAGHFLINCYGDYSGQEPNEAQLDTIANLMAWAAVEYKIDPLEIYGHRDLAQTSCPGDNLQAYITNGELEKRIKAAMAIGQPKLEWLDEVPAEP